MAALRPRRVRAKLGTRVEGRLIDDHGRADVECDGSVDLTVEASQVYSGHLNDLRRLAHHRRFVHLLGFVGRGALRKQQAESDQAAKGLESK